MEVRQKTRRLHLGIIMSREDTIMRESTLNLRREIESSVENGGWTIEGAFMIIARTTFISQVGRPKGLKRACMKVFVALGDYIPITDEEFKEIPLGEMTPRQKRRSHPKHRGVRHKWVGADSSWNVIGTLPTDIAQDTTAEAISNIADMPDPNDPTAELSPAEFADEEDAEMQWERQNS